MAEDWYIPIRVDRVRVKGDDESPGHYEILPDVPASYYPGGKRVQRLRVVTDEVWLVRLDPAPNAEEVAELRDADGTRKTEGRPGKKTQVRVRSREVDLDEIEPVEGSRG